MESPEIKLPTPMTPETRRAIQGICIDSHMFACGPNDWGAAAWYKEYPGFSDKQYRIFKSYPNGMTAKQHRNILKKAAAKGKR